MHTLRTSQNRWQRRGLALTDFLVGTLVFLLALSLFVAYVNNQSRPHARRMECQNNLKQISLAALSYAGANQGELPDLTRRHGEPGTAGELAYPWVIDLLPFLDNAALFRFVQSSTAPPFSTSSPAPRLKVLSCPNDMSRQSQEGGLSYVANAGYMREDDWGNNPAHHGLRIDWDRDGSTDDVDLQIARSTGLFWRRDTHSAIGGDEGKPITLDFVAEGDGQSPTMMFSENLQAATWLSSNTGEIAFGIFVTVGSSDQPDPVKFPFMPKRDHSDFLNFATSRFDLANLTGTRDASPGSFPRSRVGHAPRPSSPHQGIVNVAFVDGRAEQTNINIDRRVWAAMLTPNGQRRGQPAKWNYP